MEEAYERGNDALTVCNGLAQHHQAFVKFSVGLELDRLFANFGAASCGRSSLINVSRAVQQAAVYVGYFSALGGFDSDFSRRNMATILASLREKLPSHWNELKAVIEGTPEFTLYASPYGLPAAVPEPEDAEDHADHRNLEPEPESQHDRCAGVGLRLRKERFGCRRRRDARVRRQGDSRCGPGCQLAFKVRNALAGLSETFRIRIGHRVTKFLTGSRRRGSSPPPAVQPGAATRAVPALKVMSDAAADYAEVQRLMAKESDPHVLGRLAKAAGELRQKASGR